MLPNVLHACLGTHYQATILSKYPLLVINKCFHVSAGCAILLFETMEGQTVVCVGMDITKSTLPVLELNKIHDLLVQYLFHSGVDSNSLSKISSLSCKALSMLKATFSLKARPEDADDENARKPAAAAPRPP